MLVTKIIVLLKAIKCYHRLMDLKNKHVDLEVLKILVLAVQNNVKDENDRPASEHRKSLLQLFGRLTSQVCYFCLVYFQFNFKI